MTSRSIPLKYHLALAAIVALTFITYAGVTDNGFLHWDDRTYITSNTHIQELSFANLKWMLLEFRLNNWHPLTWLSHAVDYALWGMNPGLHHITSVVLHAANALLVFYLTVLLLAAGYREDTASHRPPELSGQILLPALLASVLFAIHPQHVESVAWLAERKDLLCAFFYLLTLIAYLNYCTDMTRTAWRVAAMVFFLMALMSKPMAISLPIVLLLLDIFPLRRLQRNSKWLKTAILLVKEKLAFLIMSACVAAITLITQDVAPAESGDYPIRILNSANSVFFYIQKWLIPINLSPFYPYPDSVHSINIHSLVPVMFFLGMTFFCVYQACRNRPYWLIGWLYYLVTIFPVVGLVKVGAQAAADRYTYLPLLSLYMGAGVAIAWVIRRLWVSYSGRALVTTTVLLGGIALGTATARQVPVWQNDENAWNRVIDLYPGKVVKAHQNLGNVYYENGDIDKAISEYKTGLEISPHSLGLHHNLSVAYESQGKAEQAIAQSMNMIRLQPDSYWAHLQVGEIHQRLKKYTNAEYYYQQARRLEPDSVEVLLRLGRLNMETGRPGKAEHMLLTAVKLNPDSIDAQLALGILYHSNHNHKQALKQYEIVLMLDGNNTTARNNLETLNTTATQR